MSNGHFLLLSKGPRDCAKDRLVLVMAVWKPWGKARPPETERQKGTCGHGQIPTSPPFGFG
jgi:hypothetical protein